MRWWDVPDQTLVDLTHPAGRGQGPAALACQLLQLLQLCATQLLGLRSGMAESILSLSTKQL